MALQMTGGGARVLLGPCDPATLRPNLEWLAAALADPAPAARPRLVVLTNPCNPTGVLLTAAEVRRAAALCAAAGAWLLLDNTYEDFCFDGRQHACAAGPHILHLFSFSKAYGMAGWRVGYLAYPAADAELAGALLAAQDTVPVCAAQLSQRVALTALTAGGEGEGGGAAGGEAWVAARVAGLAPNRAAARAALAPLGAGVSGGEGAIYYFARLPEGCADDGAVVEWLVRRHRVCVIPGGACGAPGHVRVAFANLEPGACARACARLRHGLEELAAAGGMGRVRAFLALGEAAQAAERAALAAEEEAQELAAAA
jgi:aspartate/methionine/tyrosine aminotransferase